jgi:glutathione S-transferase
MDLVAAKATRPTLVDDVWCVADMWAFSAARWVLAFPGRAKESPQVAQMLTLGFELPAALATWVRQHEGRAEVRAIYG